MRDFRAEVAFAITVTQDPRAAGLLDGAAVLAYTIRRTHARWSHEMVAILHPVATACRAPLARIGYRLLEFAQPIHSAEIEGAAVRERIDRSGCCGSAELLKLAAYRLFDYRRVLLLDVDVIVRASLAPLIGASIARRRSIAFTYDHAMTNRGSAAPLVQGGFLLLTPSASARRPEHLHPTPPLPTPSPNAPLPPPLTREGARRPERHHNSPTPSHTFSSYPLPHSPYHSRRFATT